MKHILLSLSTLSLCACSIEMESQDPVIEPIALQEEYAEGGITCTAEGKVLRVSGLLSKQVEVNINSYFDEYAYQIQEDIRNCSTQYQAIAEEGVELSEHTTVDFHVTLIDDEHLSILLLQSKYFDGAAYPNNSIETFVFDLSTGQPIVLEDFVNDMQKLTELVSQKTSQEGLTYPSDTSNAIEKFYLTEDAVVLVDLFSVHAVQAFEVSVP
ncbi:MAG: hypothetical protein QF793_00190, partial [Candidatus Peribacteraceae bacterium]|nr:hypothetical protein [Candidatus Peribacteraceae bacterium]